MGWLLVVGWVAFFVCLAECEVIVASHIPWPQTFVRAREPLERRFEAVDIKCQT